MPPKLVHLKPQDPGSVTMDDLLNLELLSLVTKVTSELNNHVGLNDKTVAEFLIAKRLESASGDDFRRQIEAMGGGFPPSLIESIDRLVRSMHPKFKGKAQASGDNEGHEKHSRTFEEKEQLFPGLSIPDHEVEPAKDAIDDALALFEGLESKAAGGGGGSGERKARKRSRSPRGEDRKKSRRKRDASRSPSRSRKHSYRERSRSQDRGDEDWRDGYRSSRKERRGRTRNEDEYHDRDDRLNRAPDREVDDAPQLHKVYQGHVTGVKDFGAFVNIHHVRGKVDGLVHVSRIVAGQRVDHPSDFLSVGQEVWVKVSSIEGKRIGLSMKDVDQATGQDYEPQARLTSGANMEALGGGHNGIDAQPGAGMPRDHVGPPQRQKKRMTSPERWEVRQMIAAGVAKASDYPDLEEGYNATLRGDGELELEEDVDIEVREEEPPFLAGQTKQSLELSPIRVVRAPDGSMNRAAMSGTSLAKERREMKQQEAEAAKKEAKQNGGAAPRDGAPAEPDQKSFAADMRRAQMQATDKGSEWQRQAITRARARHKPTFAEIQEQRRSLPVFGMRTSFLNAVRDNNILIVVGETGSGKTTQLTQYLAEEGYADNGIVGCTQPRRVAAMNVAKRVADEVGCPVGDAVGYTVRFDDKTSPSTRIKYMTDGMFTREVLTDPDMKRYSCIMLDEAHERTINTDVLFALLKKASKRRPDLRVIVTSATLDSKKFSAYFNDAPIFEIPGRTFPVEEFWNREPESDYLDAAIVTCMQIHLESDDVISGEQGDILVFLTGQDEIETACEVLNERMKALQEGGGLTIPPLIALPMYAGLPPERQALIFEPTPPGSRKVVFATNVAEASITVDGIVYVVDPGFVKQKAYDPKLGMDSLVVTPISQASAKQRAGRAGRTRPGKCYRLYTQAAFESEMLQTTMPEIQRTNLAHTILMLKAMGIDDLLHFDFMDPPPVNTMLSALEELYALSALDDEGLLTRLGRKMANFPMDPPLAKVLLAAVDHHCTDEMLSIVSMLEQNVFNRPREKQNQADQKKSKFHDPHGDHLTLLNVYNAWKHSGFSAPWCIENFIHGRALRQAKDIRNQLVEMMNRYKHPITSCGRDTQKVRQALCSGFFRNAARKDPQEGFKTLIEGTPVYMHPSSSLFGKQSEWVLYHTLVLTTKEYMHHTTSIEPKWLVEAAPTFFKVAGTEKLSKRKAAERIQPLYNKFAGEDDWRLSAQRRGGRGGGGGTWG